MKLEEAWLKIMKMENSENYTPVQIYSILADLGVFKTNPKIRLCIKSALNYSLWDIINSPSSSFDDINLLKVRLEEDGFAEAVIKNILEISESYLYNVSSSNKIKSHVEQAEGIENKDSSEVGVDENLCFMGVPIGEVVDMFKAALISGKFSQTTRTKKNHEFISEFRGTFGGIRHTKVELYHSLVTKKVYKIIIAVPNFYSQAINKLVEIYKEKYTQLRPVS